MVPERLEVARSHRVVEVRGRALGRDLLLAGETEIPVAVQLAVRGTDAC